MEYPPNNLPRRAHESGDEWVFGPDGVRHWGRFGAAGLLAWHREGAVMLQLRSSWSHHGDTWGIPGGALRSRETPVEGAMREANEEAGVQAEHLTVLFTSVLDLDFWRYTTVVAETADAFPPVISDAESQALAWVDLDDVAGLALHPAFGASWPNLRQRLDEHRLLSTDY